MPSSATDTGAGLGAGDGAAGDGRGPEPAGTDTTPGQLGFHPEWQAQCSSAPRSAFRIQPVGCDRSSKIRISQPPCRDDIGAAQDMRPLIMRMELPEWRAPLRREGSGQARMAKGGKLNIVEPPSPLPQAGRRMLGRSYRHSAFKDGLASG